MRISDWSSDVCSSDLIAGLLAEPAGPARRRPGSEGPLVCRSRSLPAPIRYLVLKQSRGQGRASDGRIAPQRHGAAARYLLCKGAFSYAISEGPARWDHEGQIRRAACTEKWCQGV